MKYRKCRRSLILEKTYSTKDFTKISNIYSTQVNVFREICLLYLQFKGLNLADAVWQKFRQNDWKYLRNF